MVMQQHYNNQQYRNTASHNTQQEMCQTIVAYAIIAVNWQKPNKITSSHYTSVNRMKIIRSCNSTTLFTLLTRVCKQCH